MPEKLSIVLAPDSFKETLSALQVCKYLKKGIQLEYPDMEVIMAPIADGGEGTVEVLMTVPGAEVFETKVTGPLGEDIRAKWGILREEREGDIAIIEMASAAGLPLVPLGKRNPMKSTTYGVGELIGQAIESGTRNIVVGLGGSATNDGGAGMLQALGFSLLNENRQPILLGNEGLAKVRSIDDYKVKANFRSINFIAASDVQNPLLGAEGASFVYGPQKGAYPFMVEEMDHNMKHYSDVVWRWLDKDWSGHPGSGAAGGLGFALVAFLNARLQSGFEIVAQLTDLETKIRSAKWVVTGEGKLDSQTLQGKGPFGVAQLAKKYKKPIIAIGGLIEAGSRTMLDEIFNKVFKISSANTSKEDSVKHANKYLVETGKRIARYISEQY